MRELFVYYRVRSAQADAARRATLAFQSELRSRHPALETRLLRRDVGMNTGSDSDVDGNGEQTWMETYAVDPRIDAGGVTHALQAEIEACAGALAAFVHGARHTEVFIAAASR